ncbi:MAG: extracellular solute-binding protein [Ruminococcaceae bacterium]|nr:extracellular solute-binding protein [Oscillospiraceae bacterium]
MRFSQFKRITAFVLALLTVIPCFVFTSLAVEDTGKESNVTSATFDEFKDLLNAVSYDEYLKEHSDTPDGSDVIVIKGSDYNAELSTDNADDVFIIEKGTAHYDDIIATDPSKDGEKFAYTSENDGVKITWDFTIKKEGMYNIAIEYFPIIGRHSAIERKIMIDDEYPFKETRYITLTNIWTFSYLSDVRDGAFFMDMTGNEIRPSEAPEGLTAREATEKFGKSYREEKPEWRTVYIGDSTGYYNEPFKYYLDKGEHTISFITSKEQLAVNEIRIEAAEYVPTYEEYLAEHKNAKDVECEPIKIDAEMPSATSEAYIVPQYDRSSAITDPQDASRIRLNTIGGSKWANAGQWIRWEVEVPEDGFYSIVPRSRQNVYAGIYATRMLRIDGVVPFKEANLLRFNYSDEWKTGPLTDGVTDFKFYLTKGKHDIEMEVTLGSMGDLLRQLDESLVNINSMYRQILMITGASPDLYRDYEFGKLIPEVLEGMINEAKFLTSVSKQLEEAIGQKGEHSVTLDKVAFILNRMGGDTDKVASNLGNLKDNIGTLGTWINNSKNQPLELDYIMIQPVSAEPPRAEANFGEAFMHEIIAFIKSFFDDYSSMGSKEELSESDNEILQVWVAAGRDQSQIIREMIDDDYTPESGRKVNLKLIVAGTLMPATLSGTGPDVSLMNAQSEPVNYAIRKAVKKLNDMPDFEKITSERFTEAALVPMTLYGDTYGLPDTQSFSMLFYRKDIFAELGIEVPKTWNDLFDIIPILQNNNLEVGLPKDLAGTILQLYQRDEPLYTPALTHEQVEAYASEYGFDAQAVIDKYDMKLDDNGVYPTTEGMSINLDSNVALDSFKTMCEFFTLYQFPPTYDFANRFRTGEMPLAVADYTAYNQLQIFAPEIRGLWEFTTLLGHEREDGTINNSSPATVTAIMMMKDAKDELAAWDFMTWWTDKGAQSRYGNELVALLGASGQYATANKESLEEQPWATSDMRKLQAQFENLAATPEMPGGYIITRNVQFAYNAVYNEGDDPVESIQNYIEAINKELSRKRQEFDLPVLEDFVLQS